MKLSAFISFLLLPYLPFYSQGQNKIHLKEGDLIFQDYECGPLCNAIKAVTNGYRGNKFSHMGFIYLKDDSTFVIEAAGKDVHLTPLDVFLARSGKPHYIGRLKPPFRKLIPPALKFALSQTGVPYDEEYLYDNHKYYCSELIYEAFKVANHGHPFFSLNPMTYRQPGSDRFFPVWEQYFKKLNMAVPEGQPGCNPGGISKSEKLDILGTL